MDTPIANSYQTGPENGPPHRFRSEKYPEGTDTLLSRCVFLIKIIDLEQILPDDGQEASAEPTAVGLVGARILQRSQKRHRMSHWHWRIDRAPAPNGAPRGVGVVKILQNH